MYLRLAIVAAISFAGFALLQFNGEATANRFGLNAITGPQFRTSVRFAVSDPVASFSKVKQTYGDRILSVIGKERNMGEYRKNDRRILDTISRERAFFAEETMPAPIASFDGISDADNVVAFGLIIAPPDMTGEAGPHHYVQIANTLFRVYNKTGQPLSPPISIKSIFQNLQTPCSNRNDGLPNLIYDQLADRWLISQVCSLYPPFRQMVAVSKTGDPLGSWYVYEFVMPNQKINDFPKMSMWPDGYYMTTNEILGSDYTGTGVFAFDRTRLLAGDPNAGYIYFSIASSVTFPGGMLPADLDGLRPPPMGTPGIIATHTATEYGEKSDALRLYDFRADFENPSASNLTERTESPIWVEPFDPTSPEGRADIAQPSPGAPLDSMSDTLMPRLAYRNLGAYRSLVVNQTTRMTPANEKYRAGVRVYELRESNGPFAPFIQSTIGDTSSSRWLASAAQDNQGNVATQYNFVTDEKPVAIFYSGHLASDPPNMFRTERSLVDGTGVQKGFGWRWGEYSGMSVDPVDDCTFWITNAYYSLASEQFSDWGWLTRIGAFKFDECTPPQLASISGSITNAATGQPIEGAQISAGVYSRRSDSNGRYGPMKMPPGTFQARVSKPGYREAVRTLVLANGVDQQQNFALEPISVVTVISNNVVAESCGLDKAVDPGEVATLSLSLRNSGAANIADLNVQLLAGGGVTSPGPTQNYGLMSSNGSAVSRTFSFTADQSLHCGAEITMTFALKDGATSIGSVSIHLATGKARIALMENFDRTAMGGLPPRWARQAVALNGEPDPPRNWRLASTHVTSGTKSLYSPAPFQAGINEIVSPVFLVRTSEARLSFQNWYELENTFLRNRLFDGSVLEIKIGDGSWQDIIAAGGEFVSGGYDGAIDSCCQNPLSGRIGWSGWSGINRPAEFVKTEVKLPASAAGQKIQLRWRVGTDVGTFREGQYIDDIVVTDGRACFCSQ
jgi:hypothetical protein